MAQRLTDIEVDEISLVRKGANRRPFSVLKSSEDEMKQDKLIDELKKLTDDERAAVIKAVQPEDSDDGVDAILKALDADKGDLVKAELAKAAAQIADLEKANERVAAELAKEVERREVQKAIEDSRAYANIPGVNPDDFGPVLRKAEAGLSDDERKKLREVLKAAHENIDPTILKEQGSDDDRVTTAGHEIEAKAQEMVKADPKLTLAAARTRVIKSHPDLARRMFEEEDESKERN